MIGHDSVISIHFNNVNSSVKRLKLLDTICFLQYSDCYRGVYLRAADALMGMRSD